MNMEEIGDFLKSLRKSKGLTQQELADMLNVSNKTVSKWENGQGIPEMSTLLLLADLYGISVDDILRGSKKMQKNEDKLIERLQYIVTKSKHQYVNHLILSFGVLFLGVLAFMVSDQLVDSSIVSILITLLFALIAIVIHVFNVIRVYYQLIETKGNDDSHSFFRLVVNTSFYLFGMVIWVVLFSMLKNAPWITQGMDAFLYSAVFPALVLASIQTLVFFGITYLILQSRVPLKPSKTIRIFLSIYLVIIFIPFMILQLYPARDVAIHLEWSGVNQSSALSTQEAGYYRLRLLWLIEEAHNQGISPMDVYEIVSDPQGNQSIQYVYYHFTEPTNYELYIELEYFEDFLLPMNHSNFEISDTSAVAYWFDIGDTQLEYEMYGYLFSVLFQIWVYSIGGFIVVQQIRKKKRLRVE